jgi:tetratricopeptide (TPR) repeat protein
MKKKHISMIIIFAIAIALLLFTLFNTVLYNYKGKLVTSLNNYYESGDTTNIDEINTLLSHYKNNLLRSRNINSLISSYLEKWINKFNDAYESIDNLNDAYNTLSSRINNLLDNINYDIPVRNEKENYLTKINDLQQSKVNYLQALTYFNTEDYNDAYELFNEVITSDSYYDDTTEKIDTCLQTTIDKIVTDTNDLNKIQEDTSVNDKLTVYKNIYNYLVKVKNESKLDLIKAKTFSDLLNETETNLTNTYVEYAKSLAENNQYAEAIKALDEGIKLLTNEDVNVAALTDLREAYAVKEPISLTTLKPINYVGSWIKEELAIIDNTNTTYPRGLVFYKGDSKSYNSNAITYNINKEYVSMTGVITLAKVVTSNVKDTANIKIYGDNKILYNSDTIKSSNPKKEINIDLKNITTLKIVYSITYKNNSSNDLKAFIILGNPILNKY